MKVLVWLAAVCLSAGSVLSAGAGRAIPIATENFAVELFKTINRRIEYDSTNFLVDLSGNYANCNFVRRRELSTANNRQTPDGGSIGVIQDYTFGVETHSNAVDRYVRPVLENWVNGRNAPYLDFRRQIEDADKFGCSVRPGCNGEVSVACLFSPSSINAPIIRTTPIPRPTERPTRPRPRPTPPRPVPTRPSTPYPRPTGEQKAKAFTFDQYRDAEKVTGMKWDNSHLLENMSGYETECAMIHQSSWSFAKATAIAKDRKMSIIGLFGSHPNEGSTQDALEIVLKNMKKEAESNRALRSYFYPSVNEVRPSKQVGCSLIPDCMDFGDMYVVVSCVFEI